MRDYTNLQWPETPFGANQRPFGNRSDMLAGFAIDWSPPSEDGGLVPVAAATVYLRVRRHGTAYQVSEQGLSIGFRATVIEHVSEVPDLLDTVDRALTRARRHAAILAGHHLGDDLTAIATLSTGPLRGSAGVLAGWADRAVKDRGAALMVDTAAEAGQAAADLDMPLHPMPEPVPDRPACAARTARCVLARCLAIGLTAAVFAGRYRWEGTFRVGDTVDGAAWDLLSTAGHDEVGGGRHEPSRRPVTHTTR